MNNTDVHTYKIQIRGLVEEEDIYPTSPLRFTIEGGNEANTFITLQTDQSGIIGLIRHLHALGLMFVSIIRSDEDLPDTRSEPSCEKPKVYKTRGS